MHTNSLTLPFIPCPSPRPESPRFRRRLRIPGLPRLKGRAAPSDRAGHHALRRLLKAARRGRSIVLGTPELPYEPLALGGAELAALRQFDGLEITVTTRSSEIVEQLDLLAELDQRHVVAVDVLVASIEPASADLKERLRTVSELSAHGVATRLVLTDLPRLPAFRDAASRVHQLFEAAIACRAHDVVVAFKRGVDTGGWRRLLRYSRLELGFPRTVPGRG